MKILVVDHNALDATHRSLYDKLGGFPSVELQLVVPSRWFDNYQMLNFQEDKTPAHYHIYKSKVFFPTRTHRLLYLSLSSAYKNYQPDIFYINAEPENLQTLQAALLHRSSKYGKLVFSSWRNIDYINIGFPYKFKALHSFAERTVLSEAQHCIAFNATAEKIFHNIGFNNVAVIPPPVDTTVFHKISNDNVLSPIKGKGFVIGFLGRFLRGKGIATLIRAVSSLSFDYTLVLIGDGPEKNMLQDLAIKLGVEKNIMWLPPVSRSEVPAYINGMDVIVLPSETGTFWREQFGRVLAEAMACNVPVIGSDSGEIPNVIGDAGLIFHEQNADELRARLQQLHDDSALRGNVIHKGIERVNALFSVDVIAKQYHSLFQRLCG